MDVLKNCGLSSSVETLYKLYQRYEICWLKHTKEIDSNQESYDLKRMSDGV